MHSTSYHPFNCISGILEALVIYQQTILVRRSSIVGLMIVLYDESVGMHIGSFTSFWIIIICSKSLSSKKNFNAQNLHTVYVTEGERQLFNPFGIPCREKKNPLAW